MLIVGFVFAGLAALVHVLIFFLESIAWTGPRARAAFGTTAEEAEATRELAFHQGFYNLFLAIVVLLGIVVGALGFLTVGATLVLTGVASMTAAAVVLLLSSPRLAAAALKQGVLPALAIVGVVAGLVTR